LRLLFTVWGQKTVPSGVFVNFSSGSKFPAAENFKQNFTHLLYVHIYVKLKKIIHLSQNWTKLCHNIYDHPVNITKSV